MSFTVSSTTDSTTSGFVPELSQVALGDEDLTNVFQQMVVGVTGIDPTLVRPRWQPQPPTQPPVDTNWCAIGIVNYTGYDFPETVHNVEGREETDTLYRLERIDIIATFYGPDSAMMAGRLRDAMYINQNHMTLSASGLKLRSADDITHVPELINSQYIGRSDLPISFMRMMERTYPIRSIASVGVAAVVKVFADTGDSCTETIESP